MRLGVLFSLLSASSTSIHIVSQGIGLGQVFVGGAVSGLTILLGVLSTEGLVRVRERRRRLEEALWSLNRSVALYLDGATAPTSQMVVDVGRFVDALSQVTTSARWPIRDAVAIRAEVEQIHARLAVGMASFAAGGESPST